MIRIDPHGTSMESRHDHGRQSYKRSRVGPGEPEQKRNSIMINPDSAWTEAGPD